MPVERGCSNELNILLINILYIANNLLIPIDFIRLSYAHPLFIRNIKIAERC